MVTYSRVELNVDLVQKELGAVGQWLSEAAAEGTAAHEVERTLFRKMLELGKRLFEGDLQMAGEGDLGEQVTLSDGRIVQRLKEPHQRRLLTIFGEFWLSRRVYGTEERKAIERIPTDQRLQLPENDVSYLRQEGDQ